MLSAFSAAAQPTANGTDLKLPDISYAALNKELDKTVAALNDGKHPLNKAVPFLTGWRRFRDKSTKLSPLF